MVTQRSVPCNFRATQTNSIGRSNIIPRSYLSVRNVGQALASASSIRTADIRSVLMASLEPQLTPPTDLLHFNVSE